MYSGYLTLSHSSHPLCALRAVSGSDIQLHKTTLFSEVDNLDKTNRVINGKVHMKL